MRSHHFLFLTLIFGTAHGYNYTCPAYISIQQSSVAASVFDIQEFAGTWYMLATNEPTMPGFCICGVNNVTIDKPAGAYSYTNTDSCFGKAITLHIKGELSNDTASPGELHENAAFFNHMMGALDPNYIFHVERDASNRIEYAYGYACLGKIFGQEKFSFNVLSRDHKLSTPQIQALISKVNQTIPAGSMDLSGMRYNDAAAYTKCGVP